MGEVLEKKRNQRMNWLMLCAIGVTILSAGVVKTLYGMEYNEFVRNFGLTSMLLCISFTGIGVSKWKNVLAKPGDLWTIAGYTCGIILIVVSIEYPIFNFWFLGSALVALMVHEYLGIAIQFILTYLYCGINGHSLERMLFYFILGTIICLLGQYLYKTSMAIYVIMIVLSCNVIFLFVMNNFIFHDALNENIFGSVGSTLAVLVVMCGVMAVKGSKQERIEEIEELEVAAAAQVMNEEEPEKEKDVTTRDAEKYRIVLDEKHELLAALKEKSPSLFAHSKKVAELAANGALILGCNENIAKAGGLYHEIGRIVSKDYVEAGAALLEKHQFPQEVIDIIRQHSVKLDKPKSKEAAIVMLSESVISTVTYLDKEKKKALAEGKEYKEQPIHKIIENVFNIRFAKGSLDESGITILEYNKLKQYYIEVYSK